MTEASRQLAAQPTSKPQYKLDFSLTSEAARTDFVRSLLEEKPALAASLSPNDFDLFVDYICCGIGEEEIGKPKPKSAMQKKIVFAENKAKRSSARAREESLDALLEAPTFNETSTFNRTHTVYKIPKPNFSRERIRAKGQAAAFEELWAEIDELEEILSAAKTTKSAAKSAAKGAPKKVSAPNDEWAALEESNLCPAPKPSSYQQYIGRKTLLDLRKTQYTLDDFLNPQLQRKELLQNTYRGGEEEKGFTFDTYVNVLPLGLYDGSQRFTNPSAVSAPFEVPRARFLFDFRNPSHVAALVRLSADLEEEAAPNCESAIPQLLATLHYYKEKAHLNAEQQEILHLRLLQWPTANIAAKINAEFGTKHTAAYISTIFTQQICERIADAAKLHEASFAKRGILSAWKMCAECGEYLLKDERNFARSARTHDGFQRTCKRCEREKRQRKKNLASQTELGETKKPK